MLGKTIQNIEYEQIALADCLIDNSLVDEMIIDYFNDPKHKSLFRMFKDGYFNPEESILKNYGLDFDLFFSIAEKSNIGSMVGCTIKKLPDYYARRQRQADILKELLNVQDMNKELTSEALAYIDDSFGIYDNKESAKKALEFYKTNIELKTSFKTLNKKISRFSPKKVMLIAARSGAGKTALGLQLMLSIANEMNEECMFFSLEMSTEDLAERLFSIEYWQIADNREQLEGIEGSINECERYVKARLNNIRELERIYPKNCVICDDTGLDIEAIRRRLKMALKSRPNIKTILIDYVQLIRGKESNRREEMSNIARRVRDIAKDFNVRFIGLSQVKRPESKAVNDPKGIGNGYDPVRLSDFKESGDWEEVADFAIGIWKHRDTPYLLATDVIKGRSMGFEGMTYLKRSGVYFRDLKKHELSECINEGLI